MRLRILSILVFALACSATNEPGPAQGKGQGGAPPGAGAQGPEGGPEADPAATAEGSEDAEDVETEPIPEPEPEPDPEWVMPQYPQDLVDGRLRIFDLYLSPTNSFMGESIEGVFEAWEACLHEYAEGCGYQVFAISTDRHRLGYSQSWYEDQLDGPIEECLARGAEQLRQSKETPPGHFYVVALGVAPSANEMTNCIEGIEEPTQEYLRARRDAR